MQADQLQFLTDAQAAATTAEHPWPEYAACEAALESAYGTSLLSQKANNLFGMKQHRHPAFGDLSLPTREFLSNEWVTVTQDFVSYPDRASCFGDRVATLLRLSTLYPHYSAALAATDGETYVREVSATWSTDPQRANKVLAIYSEWEALQT